jgi:hypothetical protein
MLLLSMLIEGVCLKKNLAVDKRELRILSEEKKRVHSFQVELQFLRI